eukprot:SAG31_NODE_6424_length_2025_cov_2.901869_4_plen_57_part_01
MIGAMTTTRTAQASRTDQSRMLLHAPSCSFMLLHAPSCSYQVLVALLPFVLGAVLPG